MKMQRNAEFVRHNPSSAPLDEVSIPDLEATFYVYILARNRDGPFAVSIAQDMVTRVRNQRNDLHKRDYTSVNGIHMLVHVEEHDDLCEAITRYNRLRRTEQDDLRHLVTAENGEWRDLYSEYAS